MKSLLDKSQLPEKLKTELDKEIILTSKYGTFSLNIFKILLALLDEGIHEVNAKDLSIAYYNKYKVVITPIEIDKKLSHLDYNEYLCIRKDENIKYYSLRNKNLDRCRKEVLLKGKEYKSECNNVNNYKKREKIIETKINNELNLPKNKDYIQELATMDLKDRLMVNAGSLPVSLRLKNGFVANKCYTIKDVVDKTRTEWIRTPNIGFNSITELEIVLAKIGLSLGADYDI